jgi:hypothetical protein
MSAKEAQAIIKQICNPTDGALKDAYENYAIKKESPEH